MANVIEIVKASITAYNDKNWSKAKDVLAADAVYDEKGTDRRIQGVGKIIESTRCTKALNAKDRRAFDMDIQSGRVGVTNCKAAVARGQAAAAGEWICLDARTVISTGGAGLATSVLSDLDGQVGVGAQSLLVAPRPG